MFCTDSFGLVLPSDVAADVAVDVAGLAGVVGVGLAGRVDC